MNFKNLKASIELNKNSAPSIITALYMAESLFDDIRESAGRSDLADCDIGDAEMLPVKMVWLCSQIEEIYGETAEKCERDDELDGAAAEIGKIREKMKIYAETAEKLQAAKNEKAELQKELDAAVRSMNDYDRIREETEILKAELAELSGFDIGQAEAYLTALRARKEDLLSQKCGFENELNILNAENERLNGELAALSEKKAEADAVFRSGENEKEKLTEQTDMLRSEIDALNESLAEINARKDAMYAQKGELIETQSVLKTEADEYFNTNILPLTSAIEKLKEDIATNEDALEALRKEEKEKNDGYSELVVGIGQLTASISAIAGKISTKQTLYDAKHTEAEQKQLELDAVERNYGELIQKLGDMQDRINELETTGLPKLAAEYKTAGESEAALLKQTAELEEKIAAVESQLPAKEEQYGERKTCYELLTSKFNKTDADINELNRKIEELTKLTDEERVGQLRIQHTEKIQMLEALQKEEGQLTLENNELDRRLVEEEKSRLELENTRKQYNETVARIAEEKNALSEFGTPQLRAQIASNSAKLTQLENVRKKMASDIQMMTAVLGTAPVSFDINGLTALMNNLRIRLNEISQSLLNCAGSLHLEEQ